MNKIVKDTKKKIKLTIIISSIVVIATILLLYLVNKEDFDQHNINNIRTIVANMVLVLITVPLLSNMIIKETIMYPLIKYKANVKFKKNFFYFKRSFELLNEGNLERGRYFYEHLPSKGFDFFIAYLSGMSVVKNPENPYGLDLKSFQEQVNIISNENYSSK